ncbi:nuclear factor 7, ovary-like isoform X2 [Halichoeres trimaculatus]|uniref:nuclear factor 7, ovary-like isoform X2 n=1 Tax=Halichoeres trimaculatus TaxID=147232 RepID=UPI003D9E8276
MGDVSRTKLEEMLTCPVCQDIFKDPRQLPCGHSVCMSCVEGMIDHSSFIPFRCPNCRRYFGEVVTVQRNYALSGIAEDFRINRSRKELETRSVYCDFCPEMKTLAKKSCLKCEVSMCEEHLKAHQELQVFTGHPLVKPLSDLQERKCPQHEDQVLKYYCNTSKRYICNLCALESKQQNQAAEATTILRRQLTEYIDQRFEILKEHIQESNESVKDLLRDQKKEKDPAHSPFNTVTVALLFLWFAVLYYAYSYSVENQALTVTLDKQQNYLHHLYASIAGTLLLDVDSASPFLGLSTDLRTAERVKTKLHYPDKSRRFNEAPQVLSARCFSTGAHVWEVEAEGYWDIAVSFKSIKRKSKHSSAFGYNAESWSLTHNGKGELFAYHKGEKTVLSATLQSSRIAVSVNIEKGNIVFSAVNSTIKHLHEFSAELTEPVCLGFGLYRVDPPSRASIVKVS